MSTKGFILLFASTFGGYVGSLQYKPSNLCPTNTVYSNATHLVPGMTFQINNASACAGLTSTGLVMGNQWPVNCSQNFLVGEFL